MAYFSQNDEERVVLELLGPVRPGDRFLDVGAADGETFSNTRALVERGWGGVYVEPDPGHADRLLGKLQGWGAEAFDLVCGALVPEPAPGDITLRRFHESRGDFLSTLETEHRDKWAAHMQPRGGFRSMLVPGFTWRELIAAVGADFRFISVDAEGISSALILAAPWAALDRTEVVCFERDAACAVEAGLVLERSGFELRHTTAENAIYSRAPR